MDRNRQASLSPSEIASLRGVGRDSKRQVPDNHRQLLLSMHLVVADGDELRLTDDGHRRLTRAAGRALKTRPAASGDGTQETV